MKHFYKLLLLIVIFAGPVAGVAQSKPGPPNNPVAAITPITVCDSVYIWRGMTCRESKTYVDPADSNNKIILTLYLPPEISITPSVDTTFFCGSGVLAVADVDTACTYLWSSSTDSLSSDTVIIVEASDKYYVTITDTNNCSKSDSITIVIKPTYSVTDTKSICPDSLPYTWDGVTFIEAGTQTDTLETINGCDSVVTKTLMVNPTYAVTDTNTICESELPYRWNEVTLNSAGDTTVTLQTINGCDSVVTMALMVNPTYSVTDTKTICQDSLPYLWNGVAFAAAGTQTTTLPTVNGCDSVVTMTLTVNPTYSVADNRTICQDSLPYLWNGVEFTEAGTQTANLETVNGCDSVVTMTLTVNPTYSVADTKAICQDSLPYTWNGVTFTEADTQTTTLQTVNGCDSVVTMALMVNPTYSVTDTKTICQDSLPYLWNGVNFTTAGTQVATLLTVNGCDSLVTMTLAVNPTYSVSDTKTICQDSLPYLWNGVIFTAAGTQSVTLPTVYGCDSVVTMTLTVNPTYTVTDVQTICENQLPYTWNGITFNAAGTQNVTLQTVNGCDSVVTMTLTVNPTYAVTDAQTICASELPYTWNGVTFYAAGAQTVTLQTVNGCDSVVTMTLTVYPIFSMPPINAEICQGDSYYFNGQPLTQSGHYYDTLQTIHGCDSVICLNLAVHTPVHTAQTEEACGSYTWIVGDQQMTYTTSGHYQCSHLDAHGCAQVDTLHLTIYQISPTYLSAEICQGESYNFFGQTLNQTGFYTDTLSGSHCDSVIVLDLMVHPIPHSTIYDSICEGSTYDCFCGQQHSTAGPHVHTLQGAGMYGCDSVVTLYLTLVPMISNIKGIVCKRHADGTPYMLVYPDTGYLYQWYEGGNNNIIIPDATEQYYAPKDGLRLDVDCYYKVRIAPKGFADCDVFTDCWRDTATIVSKMRILPNPNDGQFRLLIPEGTVSVQILNVNGQVVMMRKVNGDEILEMNTGLANGLYFVKTFRADGNLNTEKLVINR